MSTMILDNAFIEIDGTDLSSYVRSGTLSYEAETGDDTAMGDDTRSNLAGLKNWSMELEFNQDYAGSAVDDNLFSIVGTAVTVKVRPDAGAVASNNPNFVGDGVLTSYPPLGGTVGDVHTTSASFVPSKSGPNSSATLTRSTS